MEPHQQSSVRMEVNLQSVDAMFATILADGKHMKEMLTARLDHQDKEMAKVLEQTTKTNGRVTALENFRNSTAAKVSGFVLAISMVGAVLGWAIEHLLKYFAH